MLHTRAELNKFTPSTHCISKYRQGRQEQQRLQSFAGFLALGRVIFKAFIYQIFNWFERRSFHVKGWHWVQEESRQPSLPVRFVESLKQSYRTTFIVIPWEAILLNSPIDYSIKQMLFLCPGKNYLNTSGQAPCNSLASSYSMVKIPSKVWSELLNLTWKPSV